MPACHNSVDTVTVSGPAASISAFVAQLKQEGVFAKEVQSAGVAFHSYFMQKTAPALKAALDKVSLAPCSHLTNSHKKNKRHVHTARIHTERRTNVMSRRFAHLSVVIESCCSYRSLCFLPYVVVRPDVEIWLFEIRKCR